MILPTSFVWIVVVGNSALQNLAFFKLDNAPGSHSGPGILAETSRKII